MSFEDTTRKMADEVTEMASAVVKDVKRRNGAPWSSGEGAVLALVGDLAAAVEKLALCVARRFPRQEEGDTDQREFASKAEERRYKAQTTRPTPPARADGGVCRDCGGMTVPTGACSTCRECGSTGGCG